MANFRKPPILVAIADGLSLMRTTAISATGYDSLANDKLTYDSLLNDRLTYKSNTRGKPEVVYWVLLEEPELLTKDPLKELTSEPHKGPSSESSSKNLAREPQKRTSTEN